MIPKKSSFSNFRTESAFTLIELMMAFTLTIIMMSIVIQAFTLAQRVVSGSNQRSEVNQEARSLLDMISGELSRAVVDFGLSRGDFSTDGIGPNASRKPFWGVEDQYDADNEYQADGIAFVTHLPGQTPKVISYRLDVLDSSPPTSPVSRLIRFEGPVGRFDIERRQPENDLGDLLDNDNAGGFDNTGEFFNFMRLYGPFRVPLSFTGSNLLDLSGNVNDPDINVTNTAIFGSNVLGWQTISDNVVSLSFRYYVDFDYDGYVFEDPPGDLDGDGNADDDGDGLIDEDPPFPNDVPPNFTTPPLPAGFSANYGTHGFTQWTGYPHPSDPTRYSYWVPALVEIRLGIKNSDSKFYRTFSRLVHISTYAQIRF